MAEFKGTKGNSSSTCYLKSLPYDDVTSTQNGSLHGYNVFYQILEDVWCNSGGVIKLNHYIYLEQE